MYTLLILGHLIGAALAVGGATMIEVHLNKATADGNMTPEERGLLGLDFTVLRIGLILSLFTGIGFIVLYKMTGQEFRLQNPVLWAKMSMIIVVVVNALLLQARKISLYWGSALSFVGWWSIFIAGFFLTNGVRYSFIEMMGAFVVSVVVGAFALHQVREYLKRKTTQHV